MYELEKQLYDEGDRFHNGERKRLTRISSGEKHISLFPLHSLRVSLITCYVLEGKVPFSIISKMLAGHARSITTYYYTRLSPSVMAKKMDQAHDLMDENGEKSLKLFLKDMEVKQIKKLTASYCDGESISAALVNKNPVGWEYKSIGLCLVGGNPSNGDESRNIAGCWNGGPVLKNTTSSKHRVYDMVPHGPENCVRCRWFITDARYLQALFAHLNFMSYKATEAAYAAAKLEKEIESLNDQRFEIESSGKAFNQHNELQDLQRRYDKQSVESNDFIEDWAATMMLITRIIEIENGREGHDVSDKIVAVGADKDLKIGFVESDSRLLQLAMICESAEYYPDMLDEVKKTSIIQDRTQALSRAMLRKGYQPNLLLMDTDQQLIAGNAFFREMAKSIGDDDGLQGFRKAADYIELEKFMKDDNVFREGLSSLNQLCEQPLLLLADRCQRGTPV